MAVFQVLQVRAPGTGDQRITYDHVGDAIGAFLNSLTGDLPTEFIAQRKLTGAAKAASFE